MMVRDISDTKEAVIKLTSIFSSEACPFAKCTLNEMVNTLQEDVEDLKEKDWDRKENRRTWADYLVNGIIGFGGVLLGFFGRGG